MSGDDWLASGEFFSNRPNGYAEIIFLHSGQSQTLHGIPALGDRLGRLIDRGFKGFTGLDRVLQATCKTQPEIVATGLGMFATACRASSRAIRVRSPTRASSVISN